ncbi:hypothetical protein MKX01_011725, partial [Papaver californicum]
VISVEYDLRMTLSKVIGMIVLGEEGKIVLEVEVQCVKKVDQVLNMVGQTVKFMTDKGPSSNKDRSHDHWRYPG